LVCSNIQSGRFGASLASDIVAISIRTGTA
jgi:hypothetical protein